MENYLEWEQQEGIIILPHVSFEEHVVVQKETKARTLLLQSLPEDHMADFHHLNNAREIWLAVKARFGGNEESKKMRKTMLKQVFSEFSVSEEEDLHKGYDRALPPSWSKVSLTLKTRGGIEYLSFDDLYNKLRSLEIDVKGGSSYGSRSTIVAPTHSAFIGAASTNTKMVYYDQPSYSSSITYTFAPSSSIMEDVLHSFVDQLEMEELDIKWQMAMLSLRINKFQNKAGRKINFNNKDSARFDRRKARCYNCLQLGHFAREYNVKKVDEKARYFAFKISEVKIEEPKAKVFVDSMLNWNEHEAENKTEEAKQVYGLMAGFESDFAIHAGNAAGSVNPAAVEFAMMGISPKMRCVIFPHPVFDFEPENREVKSLYESNKSSASETYDFTSCVSSTKTNDSFSTVDVKILPKYDVKDPSPTNGFPSCSFKENVKPTRNLCNKSGLDDRIHCKNNFVRFKKCFDCGSKSHLIKDCDVYDNVDNFPFVVSKATSVPAGSRHSSSSTSAGSSIPAASRNRPASIHAGRSISAASRNKPASIHTGRSISIPTAGRNRPASIHAGRSIPAASRNRPASIHASSHIPAGRINKPSPFPAGRSVPTGWTNPAARPFFRPTNLYFDNV
nr:ribonuclease H-like domain-containing protein [Tanacetum cinerariifolium]